MIRIGIIGSENYHAKEFAALFNKCNNNGEYNYPNCRVTMVFGHYFEDSEKLAKDYNIDKIAVSLEEMVENVDAVMITARDGKFHAEFARPFIEAGIPAFIDKPFTTNVKEAEEIIQLAKEKNVPLCGGSSLKYSNEIQELKKIRLEKGKNLVAGAISAPLNFESEYSGFWFYSSHLAEMCMEIFGYKPVSVVAVENNKSVHAIVNYNDFSVNCTFTDSCYSSYFGSIYALDGCEQKIVGLNDVARKECDAFVKMVTTGVMPFSYEQLTAPVYLLDAIVKSYKNNNHNYIFNLEK